MKPRVYLGLGSNLEDRRSFLNQAVLCLRDRIELISPVYESPALLPENATPSWNSPYLNLVLKVKVTPQETPETLIQELKKIEVQIGRTQASRWAPRKIDIDLLYWENEARNHSTLTLPHRDLFLRAFVLDPLKDVDSQFLPSARKHPRHSPLWMGIVNLTPDSFSDGGSHSDQTDFKREMIHWIESGVQIIDLGGESTRPGGSTIDAETEWSRLVPYLEILNQLKTESMIFPWLSIDTHRAKTARRALDRGVQVINDVSGLRDPEMISILKDSNCRYVLTHSLAIPADPKQTLPRGKAVVPQLKKFLDQKINQLDRAGIQADRIIFDPGIGFGKDALQSLEILQGIEEFGSLPFSLMIGHSRKSFMKLWSARTPLDRDYESIGISLELANRGVDILRVHNPILHQRAHLAGMQVRK